MEVDSQYTPDDQLKRIWKTKYNEQGDAIYRARIYPQRNDKYTDSIKHIYNKAGKIINYKEYDAEDGTLGWEMVYEYNDQNQKVRTVTKFNHEPREEKIYRYKDGLKTKKMGYLFDDNGQEKQKFKKTLYQYDETGQLVKEKRHHLHLDGKPVTTYSYKYNQQGDVILEKSYKKGALDSKTIYRYEYYDKH